MLSIAGRCQTSLGITARRTALVAITSGLLAVTEPHALAAEGAKSGAKSDLTGTTWNSIQKLPDFGRGMWTPGRPPRSAVPADRPAVQPPVGAAFGFNVPFQQKYKEKNEARMQRVRGQGPGGESDIPLSNSGFCIPSGVPGNMALVSHEYVFKPGEVIMILENSEIRRIYVDGRGHPSDDESN